MKPIKLLEKLSNLHGAPGHEDDVVNFIQTSFSDFIIERDCLNNLFVKIGSESTSKPIVALDCHSDEVGFMVQNINPNGTISFLPLGGWHIGNVPTHPVVIKNFKNEYVKGIVASKPPHFMSNDEKQRLPTFEELVIDIGSNSFKETVETYSIEIGNPITPDVQFSYDSKIKVMRGKAFDNRLGCAAVLTILAELKSGELPTSPVGVICSQEEAGLRGAQVASNKITPDFAIIFEGSPADDTFKEPSKACGVMGQGVQFRVIDAGMISNPRVLNFAKKIAQKNNIPYQVIARNSGQTNGAKYHTSQLGVPTLVIGIPTRYIHTHYAYASHRDFDHAILLGKKLLESLSEETIKSF